MDQQAPFRLLFADRHSQARRGRLRTPHGPVETPVFMPVGTQGTVKGVTVEQLRRAGPSMILGNTYHLNLRPGPELIRERGGLHGFMGWDGPILTDSGGFQAFSLADLREISDAGIAFRSHLDGSPCFLGPSEVMSIQDALGSDVAMVIDVCSEYPVEEAKARSDMMLTLRWAERCRAIYEQAPWAESGRLCFGIAQGSTYEELRKTCARELAGMDFPGYAIGGLSVGESAENVLRQAEWANEELPVGKPRYAMGLGKPPQLLDLVARGVDMFDCVMPTRAARHGTFFTEDGPKNIRNARFATDHRTLQEVCGPAAESPAFGLSYVRHLFLAGETLAGTLLSIHNLCFYVGLLREVRVRLQKGEFVAWAEAWKDRYEAGTKNQPA